MTRLSPSALLCGLALVVQLPLIAQQPTRPDQPNIAVIISEDMGPDLGCWGVDVHTPNIDRLARDGVRYTQMFGTASVCMPNRTAMITGVTQTTLGSVTMRPPKQFMRELPEGVQPLPRLLQQHGYFTGNIRNKRLGTSGKNDWNFRYEGKAWQTQKLAELVPNQPFYAQFNIQLAHRPFQNDPEHAVDPAKVDLPPYYPDHQVSRRSWADYLETIQLLDKRVGRVLDWLDSKQLTDNTIVVFLSDHGEAFARAKGLLYDCGLNQPLIIRWPQAFARPESFRPGATDERLLAAIDLTAQTLAWAGATVPDWMHGTAFLGEQARSPREQVFSAADHYGGSKLKTRSVRTNRFKYIRNFNTELSVNESATEYRRAFHAMYHLLIALDRRGQLSPLHKQLLVDNLPDEELYDLQADPHELRNLADDPAFADHKRVLRKRLDRWIRDSNDLGFVPLDPAHAKHFEDYKRKSREKYRKRQQKMRDYVESTMTKDER